MGTKTSPAEIMATLAHFTGTEMWYQNTLSKMMGIIYTEGIKAMADLCEAHWLVDAILSHQPKCKQDPKLQEIQFWTLIVSPEDRSAVLICERDAGDVAIRQEIEFTDFPLGGIQIWVANGVMYLPSEH